MLCSRQSDRIRALCLLLLLPLLIVCLFDPFASEAVTAFMGSVAVPCADSANSGAAAAAAAPVTGTSDSWQ